MNEIFGFSGDEFYVCAVKGVAGWRFAELLMAFPLACVIGVLRTNEENGAQCMLVPDMDLVVEEDDQLVLMAEDAESCPTVVSCGQEAAAESIGRLTKGVAAAKDVVEKEVIVFLGWNELT